VEKYRNPRATGGESIFLIKGLKRRNNGRKQNITLHLYIFA
jgi:hypothetical protein